MSYLTRGKTKKYSPPPKPTPPPPTAPTPKKPSPKKPKIITTVKAPTVTAAPKAVTKPTTTRKVITQQPAGKAVQQQFKQAVSSAVKSVGIDFGVPTVKTTVQETPTEIITITEKPEVIEEVIEEIVEEPIIEEPIIEEPFIEIPELLPEVFAEEQIILSDDIIQILNDIENGVILVPDWFRNNIDWVKSGHITQQEFRTAYNYLVDQQIAHPPEENLIITDNMVTQQVINFNIINGRAVGSIKFVATNNFNPFYYNKNIVNIIQIKDPNGVTLLTKENRLNFTETEREEIISYDEDMHENTRATVESFVWSSATAPTAFSKMYSIEISEKEPPKPLTLGFMGAGVAGAIAGLVLIGFIADHKRGK